MKSFYGAESLKPSGQEQKKANSINNISAPSTEMFHIKHDSLNTDFSMEILPIDQLVAMKEQPRTFFDQENLEGLAKSILAHGIIQPLIVTPCDEETKKYFIIAGERRWRAAKLGGLTHVPCVIRDIKDHNRLELAIIENIQREELSAVDEAIAYRKLLDEHDFTHDILAERIGKSRPTITNSLRLLLLPKKILADLADKVITAGHARTFCVLENEALQLKALNLVVSKKLSVRQTEDLVKKLRKTSQSKMKTDTVSADLRYICDQFKGHLGTKVKITGDSKRGKIEINYYTADDLERIAELILGHVSM